MPLYFVRRPGRISDRDRLFDRRISRVHLMQQPINLVKVFSATKSRSRDGLGEHVTRWLRARPNIQVIEGVVSLSSDRYFHCLSIVLLCHERA